MRRLRSSVLWAILAALFACSSACGYVAEIGGREVLPPQRCAVALVVGDMVLLNGSSYWVKADANGVGLYPALGVVTEAAAKNGLPEVCSKAVIAGYSGLTVAGPVYLSETAGSVTQTAPAYVQAVGMAVSAARIAFDVRPPITLTAAVDATTLKIAGVQVTATAVELNTLDGVAATLTYGELNILDGVTSTAAELNALDGITATVGELNYTDTTAGTVVASKAVVVDASKNIGDFGRLTAAGLEDSRFYWCDDFAEAAAALASTVYAKAHWTGGGTNGTQAIVAGLGGEMQLSTTATGTRTSTLTFSTAIFATNSAPMMKARLKTSNLTNSKVEFGWYASANDFVMVKMDTGGANTHWWATGRNNGGTITSADGNVQPVAGTYATFTLRLNADESFHIDVDGTEISDELETAGFTAVAELTTFKPYFYVDNKDQAEEKILSLDYVKLWQDR